MENYVIKKFTKHYEVMKLRRTHGIPWYECITQCKSLKEAKRLKKAMQLKYGIIVG